MGKSIHRRTLFKVSSQEKVEKLLEAYKTLDKNQSLHGKPYILGIKARELLDDPRSQGYTVVAQMKFRDWKDLRYFDTKCPAHAELRETAMKLVTERPLVIGWTGSDVPKNLPMEKAE
ncbi:hypothetical protein N658DRAFT_495619 [Parathielavia hyrcaniae]|uniref:Stress-response A/B barrel domain-containing protein n=1 Tax=Parathielavia hyrcaniae TaxID=113614 RepID=A0AAN6T325_9PEZI|nr:hypothetical protein N658DRAFT_495619 [Parathielavia hyrcaniae]